MRLIFVLAPVASFAAMWVLSKMREHAVLEKAKHKAASLDFWKNVFAAVGVALTLLFILSWMFGGN